MFFHEKRHERALDNKILKYHHTVTPLDIDLHQEIKKEEEASQHDDINKHGINTSIQMSFVEDERDKNLQKFSFFKQREED